MWFSKTLINVENVWERIESLRWKPTLFETFRLGPEPICIKIYCLWTVWHCIKRKISSRPVQKNYWSCTARHCIKTKSSAWSRPLQKCHWPDPTNFMQNVPIFQKQEKAHFLILYKFYFRIMYEMHGIQIINNIYWWSFRQQVHKHWLKS